MIISGAFTLQISSSNPPSFNMYTQVDLKHRAHVHMKYMFAKKEVVLVSYYARKNVM